MALPVNINELINGRTVEWERIEFKKGWNRVAVLHTICAFANDFNNWGGGYIIIGIKEKNGLPVLPPEGLPLLKIDAIQKELIELCNRLRPPYFPVAEPVNFQGKNILIIWVPGGTYRPYKCPEKFSKGASYLPYIRRYSTTKKANTGEEQELLSMANRIPFDDQTNHHAEITDLNLTLIQAHLAEIKSDLLEETKNLPFSELCRRMNTAEGPDEYLKPKNVGLLFFNDDPKRFFRGAQIDVVEFQDDVGDRFTEKIFTGPIQNQVRSALNYINSSIITESVRKVPQKAEAVRFFNYPYGAVEEALVNAVYHRSYQDDSPVEVRVFPNRIEILSYPGPVPPLGMDNLMRRKVTARKCRNRRIGDFLKELYLAEGRGTGFPKIRRTLEANGSPGPIFETDEERTYFLTTLHIHPESQVSGQVAGPVRGPVRGPVELTDIQYKILLECSTKPLSAKEITGRIGLASKSGNVKRALAMLRKNEYLSYTIPEKPGSRLQKYRITKKGLKIINEARQQ
ncbi:MAG: putative DNA binding domain-containing protein [Deltaproteobacteria bacterium]|nr:putative DNA binding domain-containing protein [Deltaproteobacteria bacterium]